MTGQPRKEGPSVEQMVPPDGGWGWFVVLGSAIIQCVLPTLSTCFGLVYVHLVSSGYTNAQVSPIPGLLYGIACLLGPVATSLSRYYSYRLLTMIGVCTTAFGLFLCTFSDDLVWFYICFGVIGGLGTGLAGPHGFVLGQMYFRRKRVTANALGMLGTSLGFMVMPPLLRFLVNTYSQQGAFLLWSGILLQALIGATLYQPVEWHMKPNPMAGIHVTSREEPEEGSSPDSDEQEGEDESCEEMEEEEEDDVDEESSPGTPPAPQRQGSVVSATEMQVFLARQGGARPLGVARRPRDSITRLSVRESMYGSCDVIDQFGGALSVETERLKDVYVEVVEKEKEGPKVPQPVVLCGLKFPRFSDILNFRILLHPIFLIASTSSIANRMVFMNFVTYIPSVGKDLGLENEAPFLLTTISVGDLIAKSTVSLVSDRGWCQRRHLAIGACTCAGLATLFVTQTWSFMSLASCCAIYGFSLGVMVSVSPVLLVEYLGLKLLPYSFGLLLFMNGLASFIIFPLTGWINDAMNNYTTTYYILSGLSLLPAVLWSFVPCIDLDKIKSPL